MTALEIEGQLTKAQYARRKLISIRQNYKPVSKKQ